MPARGYVRARGSADMARFPADSWRCSVLRSVRGGQALIGRYVPGRAGLASSLFGRAEELGDRVRDEVGCLQREEVTAILDNAQADSRGSLEDLSRLVGL